MPYDRLEELCHSLSGLNRQMMRVVSKEITADQRMLLLLGKRTAEERLAAFLLSLSSRYQSRGLSATAFNLPMSRQDIGNYLGLAIETVSRLFAHFPEGWTGDGQSPADRAGGYRDGCAPWWKAAWDARSSAGPPLRRSICSRITLFGRSLNDPGKA